MALTLPSHRIQSIHGVFGSPSWSSILPASSSSHSHELSFTSLPNTSFSSVRGRAANLALLQARTAMPSNTAAPSYPVVTRPRRSSIHGLPEFTIETQSQPQPRAHTRPAPSFHRTQMMSAYTAYSAPSNYVYSTAAPIRAQRDDQRTAKLVASVLLSRASGKPMRRRCLVSGDRPYVKSGLSQMVAVEC